MRILIISQIFTNMVTEQLQNILYNCYYSNDRHGNASYHDRDHLILYLKGGIISKRTDLEEEGVINLLNIYVYLGSCKTSSVLQERHDGEHHRWG